jgi:hypothetical protein
MERRKQIWQHTSKQKEKCRNRTRRVVWRETTTLHTTANWLYILRRRRFGSKGEKAVIQAREKAEKF